MIRALDYLSFFISLGYSLVFFLILQLFLPLRKNILLKLAAYVVCAMLSDIVIYANDIINLAGALALFLFYIFVFYRGTIPEKLSVILMFYPALIAVNYLMLDISGRIFFSVTRTSSATIQWTRELLLFSTAVHTFALFLRLLFWIGALLFLRKFLSKIILRLNTRMWMLVDMLMLASFVAIFTILCFMPNDTAIAYPISAASIFSSFGCMYLASYICDAMQTAYRAQELETQRNYYRDRIRDEERVRSIYHDLKNHLLVLQAEAGGSRQMQESLETLQSQMEGYENYQQTGNEFLDILIRDKARTAQEKQIDFHVGISFGDGCFIDPLDISTIFGNALDNAIEANEKLPEDQRLITVKADRIRNMLIISVANNSLPHIALSEGTTKRDTFLHGFGLPNIRSAVQKYGGQCSTKSENGIFTLKIVIPIP